MRFLSEHHLRRPEQFQYVYALRKRFPGDFYVLYYRDNKIGNCRLGVVASNRNVRRAVDRSRVKRMVRETFRSQQQRLKAIDIVVVAKPTAVSATKRELRQCLDKLFMQLIKYSDGLESY